MSNRRKSRDERLDRQLRSGSPKSQYKAARAISKREDKKIDAIVNAARQESEN